MEYLNGMENGRMNKLNFFNCFDINLYIYMCVKYQIKNNKIYIKEYNKLNFIF